MRTRGASRFQCRHCGTWLLVDRPGGHAGKYPNLSLFVLQPLALVGSLVALVLLTGYLSKKHPGAVWLLIVAVMLALLVLSIRRQRQVSYRVAEIQRHVGKWESMRTLWASQEGRVALVKLAGYMAAVFALLGLAMRGLRHWLGPH